MSKALRLVEYLQHILEAIDRLKAGTDGLDKERFIQDTKPQDIAVHNIEVIGEASNNIIKHYPKFAAAHPELKLKQAYDMRNRLIHGYFDIGMEEVWDATRQDIPILQKQVQDIIQTLEGQDA